MHTPGSMVITMPGARGTFLWCPTQGSVPGDVGTAGLLREGVNKETNDMVAATLQKMCSCFDHLMNFRRLSMKVGVRP